MEQDLKMRQLELTLEKPDFDIEAFKTLFVALQHQNFVMANSLTNLIDKWPKVHPTINEVPAMFGILYDNRS